MPQGGRLTIETNNVELDTAYHQGPEISVPPGRYVLLAVTDTGMGMDAETQLHIFEPFFTTKEAGKGTGLGLATVYGIVKQSQGFVWVYSELGKGSSFKIYLPRVDLVADAQQTAQSLEPTPVGTETILLVEDEATVRQVTRVYLESKGYTVLEAADAREALNICKDSQRPIQVLITDMVMPGLGGLELAKSASKLRPGLAIVLVSGYTDRAADTECADIGAQFLQKPFSLDALARTVRFLLAKTRQILLIEDSKFIRAVMVRALTAAGYTVNPVIDGEEGLRLARRTRPDLILLDATLPKLSGPEVLLALKKDASTKDIPVIVLSTVSEKQGERFLGDGAAAYLEKSDKLLQKDSATLIETVVEVLGKTSASNP
jgi:CheY-like chemotaxis protein